MRTSKRRILSMVLALMLCFSVLPVTAFAGGGPEDGSDKVLEYWSQDSTSPQDTPQTDQQTGQPATGQQPQQGEPLSVDSEFFTRDLLYSKDTHKQFITVEGRDGNIFYIDQHQGFSETPGVCADQLWQHARAGLISGGDPAGHGAGPICDGL